VKPSKQSTAVVKNGKISPLLGPLLSKCITAMSTIIVIFPVSKPGDTISRQTFSFMIPTQIAAQLFPVHTEHLAKYMNWILCLLLCFPDFFCLICMMQNCQTEVTVKPMASAHYYSHVKLFCCGYHRCLLSSAGFF